MVLVVLSALDHKTNVVNNGSPLLEHLKWFQNKKKTISLDPSTVRDQIINKVKSRIIYEKMKRKVFKKAVG